MPITTTNGQAKSTSLILKRIAARDRKACLCCGEPIPKGTVIAQITSPLTGKNSWVHATCVDTPIQPQPPTIADQWCPRYQVELVRSGSIPYQLQNGSVTGTEIARKLAEDISQSTMQNSPREKFAIITLDTKYNPIGWVVITEGTLDASLVHPRQVFAPAILQNAAAILLVHNHPSGVLTPSQADLQVTEKLTSIGTLMGIEVLDHIIVGYDDARNEWKSLSIRDYKS